MTNKQTESEIERLEAIKAELLDCESDILQIQIKQHIKNLDGSINYYKSILPKKKKK